ncbi:MAG: PIN domain-containing protein [Xenococcaceae cyanobacterium MO_188.B29]|nr:PIN domain-containing protein [Xenococcaceae cyanobacterium MO_188.B29]
MAFLLDTCTVSDYIKGDRSTVERLKQESPINICISTITVFEIEFGLQLKPSLRKKIEPQLEIIYRKVKIIDFSMTEAYKAAEMRKDLKQAGTLIGFYDLLIAATAKANDLILVTSNVDEFDRVDGLELESWRKR